MKQKISWLIFILFIVLVEWFWGWLFILRPWTALDMGQVLSGVMLLFLSYSLRTLRLYDYFHPDTRWWGTFRLMLMHNFLNNVLPARLGEISFPLLMKRYFAVDYIKSTPVLLWFRLLDLHALLLFVALAWLIEKDLPVIYSGLLVIFTLVPIVVYQLKPLLAGWLETLSIKIKHQKLNKIISILSEALQHLPDSYWQLFKSIILTWLNWAIKLIILAWFMGLFLNTDQFALLMSAVIAGELTSILPVHAPGGVGTYEAGIIAVLLTFNAPEQAATAAVNTHLFILGSSLIGYAIAQLIPVQHLSIPDDITDNNKITEKLD